MEALTRRIRNDNDPTNVGSALFPSLAERVRVDNRLTAVIADTAARIAGGAVGPTLDMARFRQELSEFDFKTPLPLEEPLYWALDQLEHGIVHLTHPRYFGLYNPTPTFPAQCADRIVSALNPQLATWTTSPAAVEIEAHVIRSVAIRAGLQHAAAGHFTSGGAEANYTALVCALTAAASEFASDGARAFAGPPVFYVSREAHLAWIKCAHQAGIGRSAVRLVATDGRGRLDPDALAGEIARDRAQGFVPVMVVATAGTTSAGMIDPLAASAGIARRLGLWYHVDAAWGGAAMASARLRPLLMGIERADSVTIDAHKWFATTMGCGMFITTRSEVLSAAFQVATPYMPSNLSGVDPYVTSMQWSRRFVGLRLFISLAAAGWTGYAEHVERSVDLVALLGDELIARGWTVRNESPLAVLCVEPPAGSDGVHSIVRKVVASGRVWVSATMFEGREVIRACVTHGETTLNDIAALTDALDEARKFDA